MDIDEELGQNLDLLSHMGIKSSCSCICDVLPLIYGTPLLRSGVYFVAVVCTPRCIMCFHYYMRCS